MDIDLVALTRPEWLEACGFGIKEAVGDFISAVLQALIFEAIEHLN